MQEFARVERELVRMLGLSVSLLEDETASSQEPLPFPEQTSNVL